MTTLPCHAADYSNFHRPHASLRSRDPFTCLPPPRPTPVVAAAASHLVVADTPHNELEATLVRVVMATAGACNDRAVLRSAACAQHGIVLDVCRYVLDCQVRPAILTRTGCASGGTASRRPPRTPSPAVTLGLLSRQTAELIATQVRQARARWSSLTFFQTSAPSHTPRTNLPSPSLRRLYSDVPANSENIYRQ
ncbi:hypothetical protein BD626DRAFT_518614 [Schizophyllum amplum]|uniref:Uncharacterized protein n=1 Tax=Schizophyllum amplum TaxID=97359 RepID=A0A550BVW7_9AGAR|nr:hypothetical protein BD626DRAFT_518614 [Auriculariopsis ampla]